MLVNLEEVSLVGGSFSWARREDQNDDPALFAAL